MIDKTTLIPTLLDRLQKMPVGHCVDIRTYKRNRSVLFIKKSEQDFRILQNGFQTREHRVSLTKMPRFLKGVLKKEFPRSNKVRLYDLGPYDPRTSPHMERKVL
ncbi:MAG: hypothetical protein ACOCWT_04735 [Desulfohalobiaceae bacterium]